MAGVLPGAPEDALALDLRDARVGVPAVRKRPQALLELGPGHPDSLTDRAMPTQATTPFWLDEPYEPRPPLDGDTEVDVCVIGGGVGGLSCARRLAQHGADVLMLEGRTVAGGASGRNGGFLLAGGAAFHVDARERYGRAAARRLYAHTLEAQEEFYAPADELGAVDAVRRAGGLRLAPATGSAAAAACGSPPPTRSTSTSCAISVRCTRTGSRPSAARLRLSRHSCGA